MGSKATSTAQGGQGEVVGASRLPRAGIEAGVRRFSSAS